MSVLIRGMEMSKRCLDCPFMISRDNDDCILQSDEANAKFNSWDDMKASCPLIEIPTPHGDLVDLNDTVHPNDSMRRMTIDEQLRRTCEGWSAEKKNYVVIEAEGSEE